MAQSSLANRLNSFDLVRGEIESTIKQAELSLERFQENRDRGEDLQNCVDFLNQLRGIFVLVELRGGTLLCQEAVALANEVPVGATDDKNALLAALSNALFILRRYVEYYQQQHVDHPELLLPIINELRESRKEKPYPDSCFFDVDGKRRPNFCVSLNLAPLGQGDDKAYEVNARRFRHMFQVGLLEILRDRDVEIGKKLLAHASTGFARLCAAAPMGQVWCLLNVVAEAMQDRTMGFEKPRKRLLMRLEKYAREVVYVGRIATTKEVPDSVYRELVYILFRSGSANPEVVDILNAYGLAPAEFTEQRLLDHRKRLYGPGSDVLKSLSDALQEEINQLKDKLDIIERGIEPDLHELGVIAAALDRLSNTLVLLDLHQLSALARQEATRLRSWEQSGRLPEQEALFELANAMLSIEEAARQLETKGMTAETDALATGQRPANDFLYLNEALYVVIEEAKAALTLAKRAVTAFIESGYDKMHLANVPATLRGVWGGMIMLEDEDAAALLNRIIRSVDINLLESQEAPDATLLEALADALTSLEYYIEGQGQRRAPNPELIKLAATSLAEVGL